MSFGDWFRCTFGRDDVVRPGAKIRMVECPPPRPMPGCGYQPIGTGRVAPLPPRDPAHRPHHRMFIIAAEDIKAGQVIYLNAVSDGSYNAHLRKVG